MSKIKLLDLLYEAKGHEVIFPVNNKEIVINGLDPIIQYAHDREKDSNHFSVIAEKLEDLRDTKRINPVFIPNLDYVVSEVNSVNLTQRETYIAPGNLTTKKIFWNALIRECVYMDYETLRKSALNDLGKSLLPLALFPPAAMAYLSTVSPKLVDISKQIAYISEKLSPGTITSIVLLGAGITFAILNYYYLPKINMAAFLEDKVIEAERKSNTISEVQLYINKHFYRKVRNIR